MKARKLPSVLASNVVSYPEMNLSIIIPAYNEENTISSIIEGLQKSLASIPNLTHEIIVIDDGSADGTREVLDVIPNIKVVRHHFNKGYGAAIKTGIEQASHNWLLLFDADGQARSEEIPKLLVHADDYSMVVGARIKKYSPWIRTPGRALLHFLANYLASQKIPDINSGFRLVKKESVRQFWHLLPSTYSLSTTITLAFIQSGLEIKYVPIHINPRTGGNSGVRPRHALQMFFLILRTITLFSPLRVFMPVALGLFSLASISLTYDIIHIHITNSTVLLFITSVIIFLFGILADQLSTIRREMKP